MRSITGLACLVRVLGPQPPPARVAETPRGSQQLTELLYSQTSRYDPPRAQAVASPVDTVVCRLYGAVHLQRGLVVHVGQLVPLQGLVGGGPPEEGLDPEGDQVQGAATERTETPGAASARGGQAGGLRRGGRPRRDGAAGAGRGRPGAVTVPASPPAPDLTGGKASERALGPRRPRRRSPAAVGDAEAAGAFLEVAGGAVGEQHAPFLGGGLPCAGTPAGEVFSRRPPVSRHPPGPGRAVPAASSSASARV